MTTDYIPEEIFGRLLECLMPENALVLRLILATGMRITDALSIQRDTFFGTAKAGKPLTYLYREKKTGKLRNVSVPPDLLCQLEDRPDRESPWLFPGRDPEKHRSRQAVWKDLHRTARLWRGNGERLKRTIGTHTARKIYAVKLFHQQEALGLAEPLEFVRVDMNHKDPTVTYLYALADKISERKRPKGELTNSGKSTRLKSRGPRSS